MGWIVKRLILFYFYSFHISEVKRNRIVNSCKNWQDIQSELKLYIVSKVS